MITQRNAVAGWRVAIVTALGLMVMGPVCASAQTPPEVICSDYPAEWPEQTIVVHLVGNQCRIDVATNIPMLRTQLNGRAYWNVCNKCGAPVDVKIFDSAPNSLSALFANFLPPIDASNTATAANVSPGEARYFSGTVVGESSALGLNKYAVGVKFSSEVGGWDEFDPELQIDENRSTFELIALVIAALVGAAVGFGTGWWFARRRIAQ